MAKTISVAGFDNLKTTLSTINAVKQINIYFTGSKNKNGISWCSLCAAAEPHIWHAVHKFAEKESIFIVVDVGDRTFWRDIKNPFRTNKDIFISILPTLIRWKGVLRLEGPNCHKVELLKLFFTN